jgi:DNA-binding transcriptional MocR family regulator
VATTLDWSDRADPAWLAKVVAGWRDREGPLYARLGDALRDAVVAFEVPAGGRLAPERDLARALGVSRSTVIAAYERLAEEGLVERRQGSGTWVRDAVPAPARAGGARRGASDRRAFDRGFRIHLRPGESLLDLTVAGPEIGDAVRDALREAAARSEEVLTGHGYVSHGLPELRRAVAAELSAAWDVPTEADEVLITNGAHQAINLVAAHVLRPGDAFAMEDPTYAGAVDVAELVGARPTGMRLDDDGVVPEAFERAITRRGARLVHLTPTGQNPTGIVMGARRRAEIGRLAADLGVPVIEDTVFEGVSLRRRPPKPIAATAPSAPIVLVGSLSKLFWGGLRLGWVRAPGPLLDRLVRLKMVSDHGSSLPAQAAALHLVAQAAGQRELMRGHLEERVTLVDGLLGELLPSWSWRPPRAGLSAWARLPVEDATRFSRFARRMGVAVMPGSAASPTGAFEDHVRISLGPSLDVLEAGIRRLAEAWDVFAREGAPESDEIAALV